MFVDLTFNSKHLHIKCADFCILREVLIIENVMKQTSGGNPKLFKFVNNFSMLT